MVNIEWIALMACIITEQNNKCAMCRTILEDSEFTLHHIIPRTKGGKDKLDNLIGLCDKCHDIAEFKELNREEIINYSIRYSLNCYNKYLKPIKEGYFMPEIDNQMGYEYPEVIILGEGYVIKEKKTNIGFEVDKEFKDRIIKSSKNYKSDGIPFPVNISIFCRIAVRALLNKIGKEGKE